MKTNPLSANTTPAATSQKSIRYARSAIFFAVVIIFNLSLYTAPHARGADTEPVDGVGNNITNPSWGSAGCDLLRIAPVGYSDGIDAPSLPDNPSARALSNLLNNQADPANPNQDISTSDSNSLSDFAYSFGQFMDHDMDNTPDGGASLPIAVAAGDPIGPDPLPFTRSQNGSSHRHINQ